MDLPELAELFEAQNDRQALAAVLKKDVEHCLGKLHGDDRQEVQFWRRTFVRAVFADIEAQIHSLRGSCLDLLRLGDLKLTTPQLAVLREETYEIDNRGRAKTRTFFANADKSIRFVLNTFAELNSADSPDYGTTGWESLRDSIRIRNRLTHPKNRDDMIVSDLELSQVMNGGRWFNDSVSELYVAGSAMVDILRQKLRAA